MCLALFSTVGQCIQVDGSHVCSRRAAAAAVPTPVCRLMSEALPPEACLPTRLVELHLDSLKDSMKQLTGLQVRLLWSLLP